MFRLRPLMVKKCGQTTRWPSVGLCCEWKKLGETPIFNTFSMLSSRAYFIILVFFFLRIGLRPSMLNRTEFKSNCCFFFQSSFHFVTIWCRPKVVRNQKGRYGFQGTNY